MKFNFSIEINLSKEKTAALWVNKDYFDKWQDGFISKELISGEEEQKGAKSRIRIMINNKEDELIETILSTDLPNERLSLYEHKHMSNTYHVSFKEIGENKTEISGDIEYTKFNGLMPKIMAKLFPGMFKKQGEKWIKQFKEFAESYEV